MPRKTFFTILTLFILLCFLFGLLMRSMGKPELSKTAPASNGIVVVELFTSEGCSSCPPADQLLSDLKKNNNPQVFLLAFHVDYWNYLGWKDRFSDAKYSQRQSEYSSVLHSEVYTPQMIVNGSKIFVGSDRSRASDAIAEALSKPVTTQIRFQSQYDKTTKTVNLKYTITGDIKDQVLNIALIENEAINNVSRGENSGRTLHHVNVVRNLKTVPLNGVAGEAAIDLSSDLSIDNATVILYLQDSKTKIVSGAASETFHQF